ncbi:hypothetical protein [Streptomyces sp. NRRL F-5126]|uniref:hypothetical protein n=1 Tax=Streptomyces sp. NRRL F-5126 TaxID=1463857 RepID=UPI0004CC8053|nr:hypothetical protein [Streptomyces sp. NRRL F-5126]
MSTGIEGVWDLTIVTPIGRVRPVVELHTLDGVPAGTAHGAGESLPLKDISFDGHTLAWKQSITRPMHLDLVFTVTVDGDTMTGSSKAGRLPSSKVTGRRRSHDAAGVAGTAEPA